jgi:diguanylate cyclase
MAHSREALVTEGPARRVLVIEDEAAIRERMERMLGFEGYEVRGAADWMAGVSLAHAFKPDVILCDVTMPGLDGFGALDVLRRHLDTEAIPIVFVTAATDRRSMRRAMEGGADDWLTKPFTSEELLASVAAQLRKRALRAGR